MEILIGTLVLAFFLKRGVVDVAAMATGRTPPSHAYRMAKLKQKRDVAKDPDTREGVKKLARHWYLDACEDVDAWRANRRLSKPQRKAAKAARKQRRDDVIKGIAERIPRPRKRGAPAAPEGAPEIPDNVIPLDRARGRGGAEDTQGPTEPSAEDPPEPEEGGPPQEQEPDTQGGSVVAETTAPTADQAGLTPHLAVLEAARGYCSETVTDVDRIRAQMTQGGVGEQVTETAGTAIDAAQAADAQLGRAITVLEDINRTVLEQVDASQGQAGDKAYVEPENATQNA